MVDRIEETREVVDNGASRQTTRVVDNKVGGAYTLARIIWFIAGVIIALLAFRFVFVLLGANPSNGFAHFIYTVSYPFARPFFGLFSYSTNYGVSRVEFSTLVAIVVYALIAFALARLVTIRKPQQY
jgi:uncharacterized protein YggT (Ycf19 family)